MSEITVNAAEVNVEYRVVGRLFTDKIIYYTTEGAKLAKAKADRQRPDEFHTIESRRKITEKWRIHVNPA